MATWDQLGELATVAQLVGLDAIKLIGLIVNTASAARLHKKNCRQFAQHLKMIGNLLEELEISELKKYPATREPLEQLEDALRRSYIIVDSCQNRSYLYLWAMGWNIVSQFKKAQSEIDRYLRIVPLITLVDNARVKERLENIERDEREYTLDEEDRKVQDAILNRDPSISHTLMFKKYLSRSYPNLPFDEALQKESEELRLELQRSQRMDPSQREVIQHLIGVTQAVACTLLEISGQPKVARRLEPIFSEDENTRGSAYKENCPHQKSGTKSATRYNSDASSDRHLISARGSHVSDQWHTGLLGCCSKPVLCVKTFICPCGTFSKIASVAENRHMTSVEACNILMAFSLILSCCCYTCCIRRKIRRMLGIKGGCCDDFFSHLMCCCCALVQEWREVKIRGVNDKLPVPSSSAQFTNPPQSRSKLEGDLIGRRPLKHEIRS